MKRTKLTPDEIKVQLAYLIENNMKLSDIGRPAISVEILGDSGLGKTSIVQQIAEEKDIEFKKINLAQTDEASELLGFPQEQFKVLKKVEQEVKSKWIPSKAIETYTRNGWTVTGESRMGYAVPEWIQGLKKPVLLVLDDYSRASLNLLQATMEIIATQAYMSWSLPKGSTVIMTSNYDNDDYIVNERDNAMLTRHITFEIKWDVNSWARWAERNNIDGRAITFMLAHPEVITGKINPRIMTIFFDAISGIKDFEKDIVAVQLLGEASVGTEVATLFSTFIKNRMDKLISPNEMLLMEKESMMKKLEESIGKDDKYRADIANILTQRFVNFVPYYGEKNKITKDMIQRVIDIIVESVFNNDLKYIIAKKLYAADKNNFRVLATNPATMEIILK